jgi:hypothetical protein
MSPTNSVQPLNSSTTGRERPIDDNVTIAGSIATLIDRTTFQFDCAEGFALLIAEHNLSRVSAYTASKGPEYLCPNAKRSLF